MLLFSVTILTSLMPWASRSPLRQSVIQINFLYAKNNSNIAKQQWDHQVTCLPLEAKMTF